MFPFFKHKTKDNEIKSKSSTNSLLSQIIENKKEIAKLNFLSPIQIENILKNNKDIDFLDFEFKKEMDYPGQIKVNIIRETRTVDYAK